MRDAINPCTYSLPHQELRSREPCTTSTIGLASLVTTKNRKDNNLPRLNSLDFHRFRYSRAHFLDRGHRRHTVGCLECLHDWRQAPREKCRWRARLGTTEAKLGTATSTEAFVEKTFGNRRTSLPERDHEHNGVVLLITKSYQICTPEITDYSCTAR